MFSFVLCCHPAFYHHLKLVSFTIIGEFYSLVGHPQLTIRLYDSVVRSGNSPGIHREASVAGKASLSGAFGEDDTNTPVSTREDTIRRACRSFNPRRLATSPRGSSPR
jgi:hypothetical protein